MKMKKKTVFITGVTGVMGWQTLLEFEKHLDKFDLRLLVRPSKKNLRKLAKYQNSPEITIIWGDLVNADDVRRAMGGADYVLHMGGMVSPAADHFPEKTFKVNVTAAENIISAAESLPNHDEVKVVYIGSVAMTSYHNEPYHWGRTGDPVLATEFDSYGLSKIIGERIFAESKIKHWVSLRQSGILHAGLVNKGTDPITFHVPLNGVLEWTTLEDSGRMMYNLCNRDLPESFWRNFYNVGSGSAFRMTNYEFEKKLMDIIGCPVPEKIFEPNWFATRNFHGEWFVDSDILDELLEFREKVTAEEYFARLASQMPWWTRLARFVPAAIIKSVMKRVAYDRELGTLGWLSRTDCEEKIRAFFGSREEQARIPRWDALELKEPSQTPLKLNHGYDEGKAEAELGIDDMNEAAEFRGGHCHATDMEVGNIDTALEWECTRGHKFLMKPRTVLIGGHWCPECVKTPSGYREEAKSNHFIAQLLK